MRLDCFRLTCPWNSDVAPGRNARSFGWMELHCCTRWKVPHQHEDVHSVNLVSHTCRYVKSGNFMYKLTLYSTEPMLFKIIGNHYSQSYFENLNIFRHVHWILLLDKTVEKMCKTHLMVSWMIYYRLLLIWRRLVDFNEIKWNFTHILWEQIKGKMYKFFLIWTLMMQFVLAKLIQATSCEIITDLWSKIEPTQPMRLHLDLLLLLGEWYHSSFSILTWARICQNSQRQKWSLVRLYIIFQ